MKKKISSEKIISYIILIFLTVRFIETFTWYGPYNNGGDLNTHWAYLAATTFDFVNPKWDFPQWIYGPWYYFLTAYTFGPVFFLLHFMGKISVHEAAMYSFLCINFVLSIMFVLGTIKLSKKLFKTELGKNSYILLIVFLPFTHKSYYNYTVENLALAFMPWIIYYLINATKLNKLKHWVKLSFLFAISATSKVSILVPLLIFISGYYFVYFLKNKTLSINFLIPYLLTFLLILSSNFITKASLFKNHDVGNAERNYPGLKDNKVFYKVDLIDAFHNPTYPNQRYSWINMWSLDFFGEYFNALKSKQRHPGKNKDIILNRISLIATLIFISWYFFCLIKTVNKKIFTYENVFSIFFFAIFFEQASYIFYVFDPELAQSFDMRYWVFYVFFLIYPISRYIDQINNQKILKINWIFVIFWCVFSMNNHFILI